MATDRTERLLNLVICLLGTRRPVSRASLRESIPGYADAATTEAFERMFERDKDELRQMGIPIDTITNSQGEVEGYRIDPDAYAMPPMSVTSAEWAVLGLAARMWNEAALASEANTALRKIEAMTGERTAQPELLATRPGSGEEALPILWQAIRTRRAVRFDYLARGRDLAETRTVEPWATVHRQGAWYLIGVSRERGEPRAFRLSRVQGRVTELRDPAAAGARADVERVIESISGPLPRATAVVDLPERGAAHIKHTGRQRPDGLWELDFADDQALVAQVTEARGRIVEPEGLAEAQYAMLTTVAQVHDG